MNESELLKMARHLISLDTTNPPGTQTDVVDYLQAFLKKQNIDSSIEWVEDSPSLFAVIRFPCEGPAVCWIGHWDVVPPGPLDAWTKTAPFKPLIQNGFLYGRGACDMKTGIAAVIFSLLDLMKTTGELNGTLVLAILADEECGGIRGGATLLEKYHEKYNFNYGLVGEPTGFDLKISRRGVCWGKIHFKGIQAHAARPNEGDNPITKMVHAITALNQIQFTCCQDTPVPPTLIVTTAHSGNKDNMIPHRATIGVDIRTTASQTLDSVTADIHTAIAKSNLQEIQDYSLDIKWLADAFHTTDQSYIDLCSEEIESVTNRKPNLDAKGGTSDGRFLAHLDVPVLEIGLENTSLHKVDEYCRVDSIFQLKEIYLRIFKRLFST